MDTKRLGSSRVLLAGDFAADTHAAKYRGQLDAHPEATRQLIGLLNEAANEQRLLDAEAHGMPALAGIVRYLESDPAIESVLNTGSDGYRFRQAVGVAVKLKMRRLGWRTTHRKGTVKGAVYFRTAEHYEPDVAVPSDHLSRALAALQTVQGLGDELERSQTGSELMTALAETRRREGRVF